MDDPRGIKKLHDHILRFKRQKRPLSFDIVGQDYLKRIPNIWGNGVRPGDIIGYRKFEDGSMIPTVRPIRVLVICGPSGVGKSTLIRMLTKKYPEKFNLAVSHTTRIPREGEIHGVDYYFVSDGEFSEIEFVEKSEFAGRRYGTSKEALKSESECVILDLNLEGVINAKEVLKDETNLCCLFVEPPSKEELGRRLKGRGISSEGFDRRMKEAEDLEANRARVEWSKCIVNDTLEEAFRELEKIMFSW